jgi:two-component system response regulator GlrR
MAQAKILIVEDQAGQLIGSEMQAILCRQGEYMVQRLEGPLPGAIQGVNLSPDLIVLVLSPSSERVLRTRVRLGTLAASTPLLIVLGAANVAQTLELFPPSTEFLVTPLREVEVLARIRRLLSRTKQQERVAMTSVTDAVALAYLVGEAPAFLAVKRRIPLMARCDAAVLITGETGTGKELCARALHCLGPRAGKPFLPINCGAIPVELFESELFGHEKGAFTSASSVRSGLVAQAEGGTLFLDEVESLTVEAQVKLLRFLDDQTYYALGGSRPRHSDVRIVAATNAMLTPRIRAGAFREDLFYRLAVLTLSLPALRERREDIPLLAAHLLARYTSHSGGEGKQFSTRAMGILSQYGWPGNVREMVNVIREVSVLTDAQIIEAEDLPMALRRLPREPWAGAMKQAKAHALEEFEKTYVAALLAAHQGNVTQAAREAQKERRAFGRLVKKYQLSKN